MDITLRVPTVGDTNELYAVIDRNREHLTNLVWAASATRESTEAFLSSVPESEKLHVILDDGAIIGMITLRDAQPGVYQLGYWLANDHRHLGIMQNAVRQILPMVSDTHMVIAQIRRTNLASAKVLKETGFIDDFTFYDAKDGEFWDEWVYDARKAD